jgi:hypothetical protein
MDELKMKKTCGVAERGGTLPGSPAGMKPILTDSADPCKGFISIIPISQEYDKYYPASP